MGRPVINCSRCRSMLFLPPGMYINPCVRCAFCYSVTRIFNPALPFLGGVRIYSYNPPKPQAKKANPPKRPSPKAKKFDPPKRSSPSSNAKKANPPKPPSPSPNAQKANSSNSTNVLCSKKEEGNPGIQKPKIGVSHNQVNGNKGNRNGLHNIGNRKESVQYIENMIENMTVQYFRSRDDEEPNTDGDDGEEETGGRDDGEPNTDRDDGEEETGGEEETSDGEEETDEERETDGETDSDLETKVLHLMMRKQKPKHNYI